ncbi:MAG: response regulator [Acaryochloris sp. RU_4_1]|nr:response regulator [Acaryochloris sp. RU_4_1]NJR54865.1 response regulator [Acaryochloris sp. CRU_2_0]
MDRILAVDDTPDNLALIETILEDKGYEISLVGDGATALTHLEQSPPNLILLDIMMPGMDGYEVTRRIRENTKLPYIPILLLTAHPAADLVTGLEAGADDFVRKPVDVDELVARVRSLLRLKHSIDEREQLTLAREDLMAHLTHDLRTPLFACDTMLKLFQKETFCSLSTEMHTAIAALIRSNQSLMQMVDTLLEVHCYEAGSKTLTWIACDLWQLAQEVIQELMPLAIEKGITLVLSPLDPETDDLQVMGDCLELRRMLTNLIGNSLKFTEVGLVELSLSKLQGSGTSSDCNQPHTQIKIEVKDTGSGISSQEQADLFKRFRKGTHQRSGSGLGLHLVSRIVEVHQGTITVYSEMGQGSIFTICLPPLPENSTTGAD